MDDGVVHDVTRRRCRAESRRVLEEQWRLLVAELVELSLDMCDVQAGAASPGQRLDAGAIDEIRSTAHRIAERRLALREIEAALARLDAGVYGMCETCGAAIDEAELRMTPAERYCDRCGSRGHADRLLDVVSP